MISVLLGQNDHIVVLSVGMFVQIFYIFERVLSTRSFTLLSSHLSSCGHFSLTITLVHNPMKLPLNAVGVLTFLSSENRCFSSVDFCGLNLQNDIR